MNVLVLNCGSSSVRFQLVQTDPARAAAGTDRVLARGHYRAARELLGDAVPQVAVFDTAFHQTMPATAYLYAIPYEGGNERAGLAVNVFCYRLMKYIASYMGVLGGADGIAFAGGIGENAPAIRRRALAPLAGLGIHLDEGRNRELRGEEGEISASPSAARVFVIPTNEEILIARDTMHLVSQPVPS